MSLNFITKLLVLLLLPLLFTAVSCNKPTEPTDTPPGRRDYVWSVDTIPVKNSVMKDMWGSSPSDIWICGDGYDRRQSLWHYDGKNFNPYNEYIVSATSFCGFAQNNIWMSTAFGRIYHYDGFNWKIDSVFTMEGYDDVIIQQLCGTSPNNIYATGMAVNLEEYKGIIFQYDGKKWTNLNIPNIPVNFSNMQYSREDNLFFLRGAHFDNSETSERLYTFRNNKLEEIYAGANGLYLGKIGERVFVFGEKIIFKYNGVGLEQFLDLKSTNYLGRVSGLAENDFFCNTADYENKLTGIGHWNGYDFSTLFYSKFSTYRTLFFNSEVIFLGGNYYNEEMNVIIKGKLNSN